MSACLPLCIETPLVGGHALRVEFVWHGDRYRHLIAVARPDGSAVPCFESVEGGAADPWPPSPPLQSLSIETLPDGRRVALLVGMAGKSHWSASIEPSASGRSLVFDIACRVAGPNPILGSQYCLAGQPGAMLSPSGDGCRAEVSFGPVLAALATSSEAGCAASIAAVGKGEWAIRPPGTPAVSATTRWKYQCLLGDAAAAQRPTGR